jgi:CMP-N-acetylneuraminic acid synthetase
MIKKKIKTKVIALIPARDGSKSISHKNVQRLGNSPLISYSINSALNSKKIDEVYVLTNNTWYADIARESGAKIPYIRSKETSSDFASDKDVVKEFMSHFGIKLDDLSIVFVWLRPTHPFRSEALINSSIDIFLKANFCGMRSVSFSSQTPYKMWTLEENFALRRVVGDKEDDLHNSPRQLLPRVYWQDGFIDLSYPCDYQTSHCSFHSEKIGGILLDQSENLNIDLDYPEELELADSKIRNSNSEFSVSTSYKRLITGVDDERYGS